MPADFEYIKNLGVYRVSNEFVNSKSYIKCDKEVMSKCPDGIVMV